MLSADEVAHYRRDGFVVARNVIGSAEVDALRVEWQRLWRDAEADLDRPGVFWRKHDRLGRIADRLDPVCTISAQFAAISDDPRMRALAAAALDAPGTLFKDKLITKPPGTFGYDLHTDYAYWTDLGVPAEEFVTLSLALDASDETNGGVEVFPGLHTRTLAPHPEDSLDLDPLAIEGAASRVPALDAGDVLLFDSRIPHRSAANRSDRARRVYIATYMHARHAGRVDVHDPERRKVIYRALARDGV